VSKKKALSYTRRSFVAYRNLTAKDITISDRVVQRENSAVKEEGMGGLLSDLMICSITQS
jgi:hypothetical protein